MSANIEKMLQEHYKLFESPISKIGELHYNILKSQAIVDEQKRSDKSFEEEIGRDEIHWWIFYKEKDLKELKNTTEKVLERFQRVKEDSAKLRQSLRPKNYSELIDNMKKFCVDHESEIQALLDYVNWLDAKDPRAVIMLFNYRVWGSTRMGDRTIPVSKKDEKTTVNACVEIALGLRGLHGPMISRMFNDVSYEIYESMQPENYSVPIAIPWGDIKDSIIESLSSNHNLWLVIASPHASKSKKEIFSYDDEITARVVTMDMDMISALTDRTLNSYLDRLHEARSKEEEAWQDQSISQMRHDNDWNWILRNYIRIGHHDRVKWLVEELSQRKFSGVGDNFPNCIEGVVGPISLQYIFDYLNKNEQKKLEVWKKIFVDYCSVLEYAFFKNSIQNVLKDNNPIEKDDLPYWYIDNGLQPKDDMKKFNFTIKNIQKEIADGEVKSAVGKLAETLDLYVMDNGELENSNPGELVGRRRDADLGMKKWATKIIQSTS